MVRVLEAKMFLLLPVSETKYCHVSRNHQHVVDEYNGCTRTLTGAFAI